MNLLKEQTQHTVLTYHNSPITFEVLDGRVFADATEMCRPFGKRPVNWLDLPTTKRYISALEAKSENLTLVYTRRGGLGSGTWISEKLILKLAQWLDVDFEIWCDEKIAELMRTGRTQLVPENKPRVPQTLAEALYFAAQQAETIEEQQKQLATAAPKLATYEAVIDATGYLSMQEAAKALGIGPKQIFAILRQRAILYFADGHNLPYQKYIDRGWFVMKVGTFTKDGKTYSHPRVYATPKGVEGLNDLLNR